MKVQCPNCQKSLTATEQHVGKAVRCPGCAKTFRLVKSTGPPQPGPPEPALPEPTQTAVPPPASDADPWESFLTDDAEFELEPPVKSPVARQAASAPSTPASPRATPSRDRRMGPLHPASMQTAHKSSRLSGHLFWLLLLTLIPLAISMFQAPFDFEEALVETVAEHPEVLVRLEAAGEAENETAFFDALPDRKLVTAHLPRGSLVHWLYALFSAAAFLLLLWLIFPSTEASLTRVVAVGAITGTVGIFMLLGFQYVADWTQGWIVTGRSILVALFYVVKFIGFSYRAALDPANGFWASFFGFTFGVGLCEELCKAVPVLVYLQSVSKPSWRGACLVGLASGVGFGVSEGITYSADYYNGIQGGTIYVVRFVSCVGLHAIWAGGVAIMMHHNQTYFQEIDVGNIANFLLVYLSVAMILHGLYDTLLKREYDMGALGIALASFAWLAGLIYWQRAADA